MAKKKKHQFHCARCNSPLEIFKKGKAHRVLVCPKCGILATNPFSVMGALKGIAKSNPISGAVVGALEGGFEQSPPSTQPSKPYHPRHHYKTYVDELIEKELHLGA